MSAGHITVAVTDVRAPTRQLDGLLVHSYVAPAGCVPATDTVAPSPARSVAGALTASVGVAPRAGTTSRKDESAVFQCVVR